MTHWMAALYPIGALVLWLLTRFEVAGEYETFDFTSNDSWVNVKISNNTQVAKECWGYWFEQ